MTTALLTSRRSAAASAALEAARLRAVGAVVARVFEVESAFHGVRAAKRKLAIARTRAELAAVVADTARAIVDVGNAATLSALREDVVRERAALALSEAELEVVEAEERLAILLGAGNVEGVREAVAAIGDEAPSLPAEAPATLPWRTPPPHRASSCARPMPASVPSPPGSASRRRKAAGPT